MPSTPARPVLRMARAVSAVALVLLAVPAGASALPGDAPITALAPAEGATVPATAIAVSYTCSSYRTEVYGKPDDPIVSRGDSDDYDVRFSASPALGPDGRLADSELGGTSTRLQPDGTTCITELVGAGGSSDPTLVGGRIYWQAFRRCVGCDPQYETGPVRSLVAKAQVQGTLRLPKRLYAGYLGVFSVESGAKLGDARVTLQRRVGSAWKAVTSEAFASDATTLVAKLPEGRQTLRAVIVAGTTTFPLASKTITVRREGRRSTSTRDDGRYAARPAPKNSTLSFTVERGGRTLRGFKASVTTFCFGATLADNRLSIVFAVLGPVRVAPNGAVVGLLETGKARELLTGRLLHGRFTGAIDVGLSTCNGVRKLTAVRG